MNDKVLTQNPDPAKRGVKVDKDRYDFIRGIMLGVLREQGPLSTKSLVEATVAVIERDGKVPYSAGWYAMAVKLDLEAKGEVVYDRSAKKPVVALP